MIKGIITTAILAASINAYAEIDCSRHKIYCQIINNKSKFRERIDTEHAMKLSNVIYDTTRKYKIDDNIFTAILMQESRYKLLARGKSDGLRKETEGERYYRCVKKFSTNHSIEKKNKTLVVIDASEADNPDLVDCIEETEERLVEDIVYSDFGISQIHYKTIKRYNFDANLLISDLKYSVEAGAQVLRDFMKRFGNQDDPDWWTRYNCGYATTTKRATCQEYKTMVSRFLRKIEEKTEETDNEREIDAGSN